MNKRDETDLMILVEAFPRCFFRASHLRQPLKVGILQELLAHPDLAIAPVRLRHIIGVYANGDGYLINMVEGAPRVGLDGEAAGVVVAGDAEHARRKLRKQVEQRKRKAARIASNTQTEGSQPSAQAAARPLPPPSGGRVGLVGLKTAALARKGFLSAP